MNTFLPYSYYRQSAESLDWKRLQKQVTEGLQLCNLICRLQNKPVPSKYENSGTGWRNHPVLKIWSYRKKLLLRELIEYIDIVADVWSENEHCRKQHSWYEVREHYLKQDNRSPNILIWGHDFHLRMRQNLVRKNIKFYRNKFGALDPKEGYLWKHPTLLQRNY